MLSITIIIKSSPFRKNNSEPDTVSIMINNYKLMENKLIRAPVSFGLHIEHCRVFAVISHQCIMVGGFDNLSVLEHIYFVRHFGR